MSEEFQFKKFEDYEPTMPMQTILAFARYGFLCAQIFKNNEKIPDNLQEMITCDIPG